MSDYTRSTSVGGYDDVRVPGPGRRLARTRGVGSGLIVLILGVWGALIPFVGPYFDFSYTPDDAWHWSAARGWLEVLPGAVAFVGGVLLLVSASRAATVAGAWFGILAGAWFVVGIELAAIMHIGSPGMPAGTDSNVQSLEVLFMFTALGVLLVLFAAAAFGRLSVVTRRDVDAAQRRHDAAVAEQEAEQRDAAERNAAWRDPAAQSSARTSAQTPPPRHGDMTGEHAAGTQPAHAAGSDPDVPGPANP